jgi:hypothetical protein
VSTCCPNSRLTAPRGSPTGSGSIVKLAISWSRRSIGVPIGGTRSRGNTSASPIRSSTAASTSCTGTLRTIPDRSRCTGTGSDRLVLYGCGDLVNDYEGIRGHEDYRTDLRLMYLASLDPSGALVGLRMVPMRARRMRLHRAPPEDTDLLRTVIDSVSGRFGARIDNTADGMLALRR